MKLIIQKPRNFINALLSKKSIDKTQFDAFTLGLKKYVRDINLQTLATQSEPNIVTNVLKPFVDSLHYKSEAYSQKGQSGIDLAIKKENHISVIFEVKKPNSAEMISEANLNKKAFHESILYFMRERDKGNNYLCHIVITDFKNWFIFDAKDYERLFWRNTVLKKIFTAHNNPSLLGDTTKDFYTAIEKEIPKLLADLITEESIDCAHFNTALTYNEKELSAIFKLLSADTLLKEFNANDSNSLNKEFYNELLYILGLEETKDKGKKIIGKAKASQNGTLYENISNKLGQYKKPNDFESVIKLIIIWVNRILFLKLLESQIVNWTNSKQNQFLHPSKINQYDQLETLFFEVLAKPVFKRTVRDFDNIPYLNSSLFEIHKDESDGITIATLADDLTINYYSKTVTKNGDQRKTGQVSTLAYLLEFLDAYDFSNESSEEIVSSAKSLISASVLGLIFEKINGYKDGSFYTPSFITMYMARESIQKTVIDKFNQAKQWQCKTLTDIHNKDLEITEANRIIDGIKICDPAVGSGHFLVSALNEILRVKSELGVLVDETGKRIKDHISVENDELIIKNDDGELFEYKQGSSEKTRLQKTLFKEKQKIIENCLFGVDINPNSVNICRLRLWIELLKSAYYKDDGALDTLPNIDINIKCGNSLISRFGLADDLNSKSIKAEMQEYKTKVKDYKENIGSKHEVIKAIDAIKSKLQHGLKEGHIATKTLQDKLKAYVREYDIYELNKELGFIVFNLKLPRPTQDMFAKQIDGKAKVKKLEEVENALTKAKEIESGAIYKNAFEWRFEFPEVLNEEGEYEGFDVVIGNPPYIKEDTNKSAFDGLHEKPCYQGKTDLWHLFTGQALQIARTNGLITFIAKNQWMESQSASNMRRDIYENSHIKSIIDFGTNMVFDEAGQQTMIFLLEKTFQNTTHEIAYKKFITKLEANQIATLIDTSEPNENIRDITKSITKNYTPEANLTFSDTLQESLLTKIEALRNFEFDEATEVAQGIIGGPDEAFIVQQNELSDFSEEEKMFIKMLHTSTERWDTPDTPQYLIYLSAKKFKNFIIDDYANIKAKLLPYKDLKSADGKNKGLTQRRETLSGAKKWYHLWWERDESFFVGGERLVWAKRTDGAKFTVTEKPLYGTANLFFIKSERVNLKYIAAILNSKLMYFYMHQRLKHTGDLLQIDKNQFMKIPLFVAGDNLQKQIISHVVAIIAAKKIKQDTSALEAELDTMVYGLYGMSDYEIKIIEGTT